MSLNPESAPEHAAALRARIAELESAPSLMTEARDFGERALLRRAGKAMALVAAIYAAWSIVIFFTHPNGPLMFNIGLAIGAAMLWSCNLRAASLVRWLACAYLGSALYSLYAIARQPFDLTLSYLRLYPIEAIGYSAGQALTLAACLWLTRELGRDEIMSARQAAGKPRRDMRIPLALGVAGAFAAIGFTSYLLSGPRVERAEAAARQSAGPGFRFYTEGMHIIANAPAKDGGTEKRVAASVAVWNKQIVYHMPVMWSEP